MVILLNPCPEFTHILISKNGENIDITKYSKLTEDNIKIIELTKNSEIVSEFWKQNKNDPFQYNFEKEEITVYNVEIPISNAADIIIDSSKYKRKMFLVQEKFIKYIRKLAEIREKIDYYKEKELIKAELDNLECRDPFSWWIDVSNSYLSRFTPSEKLPCICMRGGGLYRLYFMEPKIVHDLLAKHNHEKIVKCMELYCNTNEQAKEMTSNFYKQVDEAHKCFSQSAFLEST